MQRNDVSRTSDVRGCSKSNFDLPPRTDFTARLLIFQAPMETPTMRIRMVKIQTMSGHWNSGFTARIIKLMSATPVTP